MGWYDDIHVAYRRLKEIVDIPEEKEKEVYEVIIKIWEDARNYDAKWDAD